MLWLDDDELATLTGYKQRAKQKAALARLGVRFNDGWTRKHVAARVRTASSRKYIHH